MTDADTPNWMASDGTVWFWSPELKIWTGWMPGEDGHWALSAGEMDHQYPDHPARVATDV